ncbi:hypothetical protein HMPREF1147_0854 [Selenomonas sp. FOBRC9]|nr:hypothetical protein HMPREF1147_0854 [Selenomonas sp. FOBRC9]
MNGYDVTYHLAASRAAFAAAIFKPRFFRKANAKRQSSYGCHFVRRRTVCFPLNGYDVTYRAAKGMRSHAA